MKRTAFVLITLISLFSPVALCAATYNWTGAIDNNWGVAGNWDLGGTYPGEFGVTIDVVSIAGGATPDLNVSVEVATLNLTGASTLTSSGGNSLIVNGTTTMAGAINFAGASNLNLNNLTLSANGQIDTTTGDITISGTVDGNFNLTMDAGTGDFTLTGSTFGTNLNNLSVTTTSGSALSLPDIDIDGNLTILMINAPGITNGVGVTIDVAGNVDITADNFGASLIGLGSPIAGTIIIGGQFDFFGSSVNVQLLETGAVDLGGGTANILNIESTGAGAAIGNSGDLIIATTSTFTAPGGADIILQSAGNQFVGNVTFSSAGVLDDVRLVDTDGTGFNIQNGLTVGDDFNLDIAGDIVFLGSFTTAATPVDLVATGAITATVGALDISAGVLNLDSGNASAITLSNAGNDFGTVTTTGIVGDTYIVDSNAIILGNFNPGADDLRVDSGGTITQAVATAITTTGLALEGTGPVELMEANEFDVLAVNVTNQVDVRDSDGDGFDINTVLTVGQASASNLVLQNDGGTVTQTNAISTAGLLLTGAGDFDLTDITNAVTTIASDSGGTVAYIDSNALTIGSVSPQTGGPVNGITGSAGGVSIESDSASILVSQAITLNVDLTLTSATTTTINAAIDTGVGGDIMIFADGAVTQTAALTSDGLEFYGAGPFTLTNPGNDAVEIAGDVTGVLSYYDSNGFSIFNNETPPDGLESTTDIILDSDGPVTQTADFIIASGLLLLGTGPYDLLPNANDVDTLAINTSGQVDFRDSDGFVLGVVQGINLVSTTGNNLVLQNDGGTVTQTREITLGAGGLLLEGTGNFILSDTNNSVTAIASDATGNISYSDSGSINVGSVTTLAPATVNGIVSGGGNITLTSLAGAVVVNQAVNSGAGDITVSSTGGGITQGGGDVITSAGTTVLTAGAGASDITLNLAANEFATLEATGVTVRIQDATGVILDDITTTNFDLDADGAVTQSPATSIQTTGLLLQGAGPFTLPLNNDATTIAAITDGAISFTDTTANLDVNSVLGTNGIITSADTVVLDVQAGALTVTQTITTGAGVGNIDLTTLTTMDLNAALTAGAGDIILNSGGLVQQAVGFTGTGLLLQGAGDFDLFTITNNVVTLAADSVTGFVNYRDANALAVGLVQGVNGVITTNAGNTVNLETNTGNLDVDQVITTAGENVSVTVAGTLDVNASVSTGGAAFGNISFIAGTGVTVDGTVSSGLANVLIDSDGAVSQLAIASGAGLELTGDGPFNLSTQDNLFTDLAASITAGGSVSYNDGNAIIINTVGVTSGITTVAANVTVSTTAGSITVSQAVSTQTLVAGDVSLIAGGGAGTIALNNTVITGTGDLILDAGFTVSQAVAFTDVTGLELLGVGPFNLNIAGGNEVVNLAADVTGNVTYIDQDALNVTTVNATVGATLVGNLLDIETINGVLTIAQAVDSAGGNIILDVGTTAGGILTFNAATTSGAGDITATTSGNIGQNAAGIVTSTGTSTFTANTGLADIDLTAASNTFGTLVVTADQAEFQQSGFILDLGNIDATIFSLDSDSQVTQSGIIDDTSGTNSLLLLGAGPFRLTQATNDIGTLAANISGNATYRDIDTYSVGNVLGQNGIVGAAGVVVSLWADALLTQTQPIQTPQLHLQGSGPFNLDAVGTNDVDLIAADVTGQLDFEDSDGVAIDTVTNTEGITDNGINTNGNLLDFVAGGDIRIEMPVATGNGQILVFDASGTTFFSEIQAAATISTDNVAGIDGASVLNGPIILEEDSSLVSTNVGGDIRLRGIVDDDGTNNTLLVDSGQDILLDQDIGGITPPLDLTLTTAPGNVTLAADLDVIVSQDFIVTNGSYNMNLANQSVLTGRDIDVDGTLLMTAAATISASRDITGAGTVNMTVAATITADVNVTVNTILIGSVNAAVPPYATINVGQNFAPAAFTHTDAAPNANDSEVNFFDDPGDLPSQAGAYTFQNLTLADPDADVQSAGNWEILGDLNLTSGNWILAPVARTHTLHRDWDSTIGTFTYVPANSTIIFDGATNATLRTDGIAGAESFNNITFDKTSGSSVTMANVAANRLDITGDLTISDGEFIARAATTAGFDIRVVGDWTDTTNTAGDGFDPQNEEVQFIGGLSNIDPEQGDYPAPYFWQMTVLNSSATLANNSMVIGADLTLDAASGITLMTANADLTVNGIFTVDAAAAAATLTSNSVFISNGTVVLQGANAPVIDFTDQDFHFDGGNNSLNSTLGDVDPPNNTSGEIRLTGEQAIQDFPTVTVDEEFRYGLVTYYNGAADGQIIESSYLTGAHFWNLTIDASARTIEMTTDINVWGFSDPNGDGTLSNNPGPVDPTNLNGLRILNGTLSAENGAVQYDLRLYGMMLTTNTNTVGGLSYLWGTVPLADPLGATVEFRDKGLTGHANPAYIEGNNTFFRFVVNTGADGLSPDGIDPNVAGKFFYFESGSTTTISDDLNARFIVVGEDIPPDDGAQDADWISLLPGTFGADWIFSKLASAIATMRYVYVENSDASIDPIVIQPRVITINCSGWVDFVYVTISKTRDQLNNFTGTANAAGELPTIDNTLYEPDGRIDRILVTVQAAVVKDFSGFQTEVDGYNVLGYDPGGGGDHEPLLTTQFWIIIEEGSYLDTGTTPAWRILENTTVIDSSTGAPIAFYPSKDEEIPDDGAPPIIGYTLAVADSPLDQAFVHFSEPVVDDTAGGEITIANFAGTVGGVVSLTRVTPFPTPSDNGMQEVILNLGATLTVGDITGNALNLITANIEDIPTPKSPLADDAGDIQDTPDPILPGATTHRISDLAIGITGNGVVEPVVATGNTQPSGGAGVGIVTIFDGSDFLQNEDILLQVHRYTGEGFVPDLYWEDATLIPSSYKKSGLWLPSIDEIANSGVRPFSGLVPRPWSVGPDSIAMTPVAADLYDNTNPTAPFPPPPTVWSPDYPDATTTKINDGAELDFFFLVAPNLYAARCLDDTTSDWYRKVRPWNIKIRDVATQAGGISILNNIINPNRNEQTTLHYELTQAGMVSIQVFELSGGLVEVLQRGHQTTGEYSVSWNGRNRAGNVVARGIYFVRYVGPGGIDQIRKILVVK